MIALEEAEVVYPGGVHALKSLRLVIRRGEFTVLLGRSGSGKSTLLRALNGLVALTAGRIDVERLGILGDGASLRTHRRRTGVVYQQHQLIDRLTALANVLTGRLPYHGSLRSLFGLPRADRRVALECLDRVGLLDKALNRVDELSGGQRQRVGIARALAQRPTLILADEPIASLDPATAQEILSLLKDICRREGITVVVSLHQVEFAQAFADRILGLSDGRLVFDGSPAELTPVMARELYNAAEPRRHADPHAVPEINPSYALELSL
jgi:phosphonate transport system ATP-binding protein